MLSAPKEVVEVPSRRHLVEGLISSVIQVVTPRVLLTFVAATIILYLAVAQEFLAVG
jgi:hypothetical protein